MKKLYHDFFRIPQNEKVCEKVLITRMVSTIAIVIACLAAMSFTAYAYFSHSVASDSNTIKTAYFETKVSIQITDQNGKPLEVQNKNDRSYSANIKENTEYFVRVEPTERSTAETGFVIVTAKACVGRFHTRQLKKGDGAISFIVVADTDTEVNFKPHWGTSKYFGYPDENSEFYLWEGETARFSKKAEVEEEEEEKAPASSKAETPASSKAESSKPLVTESEPSAPSPTSSKAPATTTKPQSAGNSDSAEKNPTETEESADSSDSEEKSTSASTKTENGEEPLGTSKTEEKN